MVGAAEPGRTLPLAAGGLLLALVVAGSTARAGWVSGAVALPSLAVLGALAGTAVGLSPVRGPVALALAGEVEGAVLHGDQGDVGVVGFLARLRAEGGSQHFIDRGVELRLELAVTRFPGGIAREGAHPR